MVQELPKIAAELARTDAVGESLDELLHHPDDRAYVQCTQRDCLHNRRGRCIIYTVTAMNARSPEKPCSEYKKRQ